MQPEEYYEIEGFYRGAIFPCGAVVIEGTLFVYYGGGDKVCAVATCDLRELIDHLLKCPAWRGARSRAKKRRHAPGRPDDHRAVPAADGAGGLVVGEARVEERRIVFPGAKSLPWWIIGVAHGSSGVDITGTMWFVMMFYIYGVKATWLLWVWPLFSVIFRMMYLGTWVRRSNVLTGAEWMRTRFGYSRGAELAYISVVAYAMVHVVGFLSYAFRGIGEFTRPFFPWNFSDNWYGAGMLLVTGMYCVVGGMYSVIMNDLIQFGLKMIAAIGVVIVTLVLIRPEEIMAKVPAGWDHLFFGWKLTLDWSHLMPQLNTRIYGPMSAGGDGYSLFMFFTGMLLLKGVLVSMAGPTPNYAIQHVLFDAQPTRGGAREHGDGDGLAGAAVPADRGHHGAGAGVFQPGPGGDGHESEFRKNSAECFKQICAGGFEGHTDRGAAGVVHEHLRLDGEFGRGLRGQRHL